MKLWNAFWDKVEWCFALSAIVAICFVVWIYCKFTCQEWPEDQSGDSGYE